ncbi:MAG: cupin domain-containing protein, partial [Oscillospiraceae bacterium]|nr:cupin domain-containing protein [Oscillospiraceae bacterium]
MSNQNNASNQLLDVAQRIREMRQIVGYSIAQMAEKTELSEALYQQYEAGSTDLPFTFMHKCAKIFGLELTELLEGHSAKLSGYAVTRKGKGMVTASEDGITIQDMAAMFRKKLATPYYVTYEYSQELQDKPIHTTTHDGQEFDLVLKGAMRIKVGDHEEILREGDSIFYKSSTPHGMIAIDGESCVFLSMIMAGDKTDTAMRHPTAKVVRAQEEPLLCNRFVWGSEDENGVMTGINFADTDRYNFAFDTVDAIARKDPDRLAMVHIGGDMTERRFTYKDFKDASSQCANYFKS